MILEILVFMLVGANASKTLQSRVALVVGLNPALQRTVTLSTSLQIGSVNRGSSVQVGIGGKGQDVIVAGASMQANPPPALLQFLGSGAEGDALATLLAAMQQRPSHQPLMMSIRTSAPCRTCVTLVDSVKEEATEIVEPSGTILLSEIDNLLSTLESHYQHEKAGGVAVMGSMPPGCSADLYSEILKRVCDSQTKVLFDTTVGIFEALNVCGVLKCDAIIKLNARELCKLSGVEIVGGGEASMATPLTKVQEACSLLAAKLTRIGSDPTTSRVHVAVTDGPYISTLIELKASSSPLCGIRLQMPPLPRPMKNPIGAGDAVSSGTLLRWTGASTSKETPTKIVPEDAVAVCGEIVEAFSWGQACGAASCMNDSNSVFSLEDAEALLKGVSYEYF